MLSVAFSPDGRLLATSSDDGTARLWHRPALPGSAREMELRTWVALAARLDGQGRAQAIPWEEWRQMRDVLRAPQAARKANANRRSPSRNNSPSARDVPGG